MHLNPVRRAVLALYGLAAASIFMWVPWRGYEVPKDRGNAANLGYGVVWAPPEPPAAFVEYYRQSTSGNNWQVVSPVPSGYISPFAYKAATIEYGRVGLEFGALTGLALLAWVLAARGGQWVL